MDYSTLFSGIATEAQEAISAVVPLALPVLATLIGVSVAIKVIKRITGR